jgi:hypothetical protein
VAEVRGRGGKEGGSGPLGRRLLCVRGSATGKVNAGMRWSLLPKTKVSLGAGRGEPSPDCARSLRFPRPERGPGWQRVQEEGGGGAEARAPRGPPQPRPRRPPHPPWGNFRRTLRGRAEGDIKRKRKVRVVARRLSASIFTAKPRSVFNTGPLSGAGHRGGRGAGVHLLAGGVGRQEGRRARAGAGRGDSGWARRGRRRCGASASRRRRARWAAADPRRADEPGVLGKGQPGAARCRWPHPPRQRGPGSPASSRRLHSFARLRLLPGLGGSRDASEVRRVRGRGAPGRRHGPWAFWGPLARVPWAAGACGAPPSRCAGASILCVGTPRLPSLARSLCRSCHRRAPCPPTDRGRFREVAEP